MNNYIEIKKSKIHGLGVFAKKEIKKGQILHEGHFFQNSQRIRTPFIGFYNYSENPNCKIKVNKKFSRKRNKSYVYNEVFALVDLSKNEELTLKYTWYNPLKKNSPTNKHWNPLPDFLTINNHKLISTKKISSNKIIGVSHHYSELKEDYLETCLGSFLSKNKNPNCKLIKVVEDKEKVFKLKTLTEIKTNTKIKI
tara:strand:+ start:21 stop:608 length:588 start_codon:yes stop_codon:yes gene_type:complete